MFRVSIVLLLCISTIAFAQKISGVVTDEDQNPLAAVMVFNMQTEQKSYTNLSGEFTIEASANNELRFIRQGFDRNAKIIKEGDFTRPFTISIVRTAQEIEEVQVSKVRLTGDLNRDAKNLTKFDRVEQLQKEIGVPGPPEKPREKPSELAANILLPLIGIPPTVDLQAIYNVLSGKAKRQKRLYKYDDLQDDIAWIKERVGDEYFNRMEIPSNKISEFLQFSMGVKPDITKFIKARNLSKVLFVLEETLPQYYNR